MRSSFFIFLLFTVSSVVKCSFLFGSSRIKDLKKELDEKKKFLDSSPIGKLNKQSESTFTKFNDAFMKKILNSEADLSGLKEILDEVSEGGDAADTTDILNAVTNNKYDVIQVQLGKLAYMYEAINLADLATVLRLNQLCEADEENKLFDVKDEHKFVCETYAAYLLKMIESRISVITSRIIFSGKVVKIPVGWIAHMKYVVGKLKDAELLSDSLRYSWYIITGVAQNNEELGPSVSGNLLKAKASTEPVNNNTTFNMNNNSDNTSTSNNPNASYGTSNNNNFSNNLSNNSPNPTSAKITSANITIDARNLINHLKEQQQIQLQEQRKDRELREKELQNERELREQLRKDLQEKGQGQSQQASIDPLLAQMLPKMMMIM